MKLSNTKPSWYIKRTTAWQANRAARGQRSASAEKERGAKHPKLGFEHASPELLQALQNHFKKT